MTRSSLVAQNNTVYPIEKIISVLSYFTCGFVGLLYLIIALLQKQGLRSFLRYHVFMSIFLSILIYVVSKVLIFVINVLGHIPFVKAVVFSLTVALQSEIVSFGFIHFSLITLLITLLYTYLSIGAIMGKYTYLPWISEIISYNMRQ